MPIDWDYVAAMQYIDSLKSIVCGIEHGKRKCITDDIEKFVEVMKEKYEGK